jgi:hypothetical protein
VACALAKRLLFNAGAMLGFRQCEGCKRELLEELFREGSPQCRTCAREAEQRNPVVRIAPGILAAPRERWAQDLIARLL